MEASTVTLSCQSVINPADTACSLTHGNCQTQQWTVVPDFHRITKLHWIMIQLIETKSCSNPQGLLQPFFRNKKAQVPYVQTHVFLFIQAVLLTRGSSVLCSLLRKLPMTGFRQAQNLLAYSGGTVRDSHPVFYSLMVLLPHPQALKRNINLSIE